MISYAESLRLIRETVTSRAPSRPESVALADSLLRVTSEEIFGNEPIPPFDNSSMDGYALSHARAAGASTHPCILPVLGTVLAGDAPRCQPESGGAWRIMTGAPIPAGCDAVVPVESTREIDGGRAVEIRRTPNESDFIRGAGRDFARGSSICPAGTFLSPRHLMALAAAGVARVPVRRKPRVALIATGRELAPPDRALKPGQIRDASSAYLAAECARLGWHFDFHGVVPDDEAAFSTAMIAVLSEGYDVILTTGAVSMGDADFIPKALKELGARTVFHRVAIKPGRPILFAEFERGPFVFGLPGNPISSVVGLKFFVEPCVREFLGRPQEEPLRLRLAAKTDKPADLRCFFKARRRDGGLVDVLPAQASFQIHSLLAADCWAVLPEAGDSMKAGAEVDVYDA